MRCRFFMLRGDPTETVPNLVRDTGAALLVTDFAPLRLGREWRSKARAAKTACRHMVRDQGKSKDHTL